MKFGNSRELELLDIIVINSEMRNSLTLCWAIFSHLSFNSIICSLAVWYKLHYMRYYLCGLIHWIGYGHLPYFWFWLFLGPISRVIIIYNNIFITLLQRWNTQHTSIRDMCILQFMCMRLGPLKFQSLSQLITIKEWRR